MGYGKSIMEMLTAPGLRAEWFEQLDRAAAMRDAICADIIRRQKQQAEKANEFWDRMSRHAKQIKKAKEIQTVKTKTTTVVVERKVGDIVFLPSNPDVLMTVNDFSGFGVKEKVTCLWFNEAGTLNSSPIHSAALHCKTSGGNSIQYVEEDNGPQAENPSPSGDDVCDPGF